MTRYFRSMFFLVFFVLAVPLTHAADSRGSADDPKPGYIYGTVVGITDGDTLKLLTAAKKTVKRRLAEIDTPERRQPYGKRAKPEERQRRRRSF